MSYSRNIPDWQQYSALQSGGSDAAKSGQNVSSGHLYVSNISPPSLNGLNLSTDCLSKSQNDVINYSQRNYQPPNTTPSGPNSLVENPLTSMVHMSSCVGHYGGSSTMNSMLDDAANVDLRNGSVAALNEEMAHRNQFSLNGPVSRVMGPSMNLNNNMGTAGPRIPPVNTVPSSRQGPYMPACKGPCCVSDPNVNYQAWEKFTSYQATNPYRENIRASGYAADSRRYRNEVTYRKDSYPNKDLIPPNSYHVDQRRSYSDYKYCKDPPVPRNYQPSTVLSNYPLPNYGVPGDYQKYAYAMKDYPREGVMNSQNSGLLKYPDHNVNMQEKYSPKQSQYQSGALLQKGLVVPSISTNVSSVQNPYLNPQFSREFQWDNHEKDPSKIQNPLPMHSAYPKYQLYQQKYAMQRFSMENHLRELSRIPGYQTHPKYQECIHRYRELLRLQQTVDYQSAIQNTLTSTNSSVPPINLQFDQNGVLINPNYLPGNYPTHNPANPPNPVNVEKEQHSEKNHSLQRLQHLSRSQEPPVSNPENIPRDVQYLNQKSIENPHCQVRREEERFEALNSREEEKEKNFANKPALDVRQFLANWDEAEEEEGANANLPDVVLSNSTPIVVVEYGNLGLVTHGSESTTETKENEPSMKSEEYFPKDQSNTLLQDCANELNEGVVYANKLNIKCVGEGIDGVPTIHIVENPEGESCESFAYNEKSEMEVLGGTSLPSLTETKECETSECKEASSANCKKLTQRTTDPKLQVNPQDLTTLPLAKNSSEAGGGGGGGGGSNLKKQSSYTEENHNQDDISLPDLTTSECTPISTTLNTPTHSDSEESSDQGVDLTTSTNPIELIQNSPMISFTQSPVKMEPYEHLKGENLSRKSSQDTLDFDFQNNDSVTKSPVSDSKKEEKTNSKSKSAENEIWSSCALEENKKNPISEAQSSSKYSQVHSISRMIPENSANKDSNEFSSNMDVFSSEDQDKWCWNSIPLIPGEENEEPKIPAPPMEENYLTKIMKDSAPITSLNVIESDEEKANKVDDMWLDVDCMDKGLDLSSEAKTSSNEKLYNELEQKIQKKKDIAEVSASVSKILKNIKERQDLIQNSMQDSKNSRRNPKGISIISEEIFNSTWQRNKQNKIYPPRKMSDSFEREQLEAFAENLKNSKSRSKSLEMNIFRKRSKSAENLKSENEEERLFKEFKNLKRKRSIDQFQEENKLPKLSPEEEKKQSDYIPAKHILPVVNTETTSLNQPKNCDVDQEKPRTPEPAKPNSSDLEIKFRNCSDSNKPFEAIKIEINVSRSDGKSVAQSSAQKCGEDPKPNQEDPSTCSSLTCSGKNLKDETKVHNQNSEDLDKIVENKARNPEERKDSVIEYLGKSHNPNISKHSYAACDTCKTLSFHKIDKEYTCTHLDNRKSKPHENPEGLKNSFETGNSPIECLSNRLKSISKSKPIEDFNRKSKLQELKHFRKIKYKDKGCFSGYENKNMIDKLDLNESFEILPCTSEYSGSKLQRKDLLKEDLSNTSDGAKHFVIKNSLNCDSSSFDEMPYKVPENNQLKSNLLEGEDSLSPKGFLNPIFSTLEEMENLNSVPVYTTKDGKITYSPNPRFTYRTLLMEARQKESRLFEKSTNYSSSTSYDKRSSKSSEKRSFSNKYHADLKPPKKSLAKRFATQELEKSYQRYLSHKESKPVVFSNEPMVIKTIKNYNAFNEISSGNEAQDERQIESRGDFDDTHSQHENENERKCLEEKIDEVQEDLKEVSKIVERNTENIERTEINESQVFTGIRSPSPGDVEDNQVVPVASSDKDTIMDIDNLKKSDSLNAVVKDTVAQEVETLDMEVDKPPKMDTDFNLSNSDLKSGSNLEKESDIQDSNIDSANSKLESLKDILHFKSNKVPERRKSTSDVAVQSESNLISERRKSESFVSSSTEINPEFAESLKVSKNKQVFVSSQEESLEDKETSEDNQNPEIGNSEAALNFEVEINSEVVVNSEVEVNSEAVVNSEIELNHEAAVNPEIELNSEAVVNPEVELNPEIAVNPEIELNSEIPSHAKDVENIEKPKESETSQEVEAEAVLTDHEPKPNSESSSVENEKKMEEDIVIVDVEEEVEIELQSIEKEDEIEIVEVDEEISVEMKEEVANLPEICDKVEEINSETKNVSSIEELELPENPSEELVISKSALESNSETTSLAKEDDVEMSDLNTERTAPSLELINSRSEYSEEDILLPREDLQKESEENIQVELPIDEIQYHHSDIEHEVEIVSEVVENVDDKFIEKETDHFEEPNQEMIQKNNLKNQESELKNCEREYLETRGLSPSPETQASKTFQDKIEESSNETIIQNTDCSKENKNESDQSIQDLPLIAEKDKDVSDTVCVDDESSCEVDPPTLEPQKELNDSEMLNSPRSSDSNQFDRMPDVTLEENEKRESHLKSSKIDKIVPKLVIRKIETNRNSPTKSKSASDASAEPSFYRKIPKMIIRNAKSRPATPTIEEIPEELPLSNEEANVIKVKIRLDDINKNESYMFTNEESRIPKMKIKLEDKQPKVVIENLDIRNTQDLQKLVPKVKIRKLKNLHSVGDDSKTNEQVNDSKRSNSKLDSDTSVAISESDEKLNTEPVEIIASDCSILEPEESRNKIPKLKIKKDSRNSSSSNSKKRYSSDVLQSENKKMKKSSKEEAKDRRVDSNFENSMSSSDCQNILEKVPKVIIKRTSPTAEFKCEVSNDKNNALLKDSSLQPQVVLQRSWILDCMAKELRHVNIALKLAIAKNGNKASVRGKSDSSKIQWEQFIRSLKKQKELSKAESGSEIFSNKIKQRRKSDCGMRYFDSGSRFYKIKACKSARESTNADTNYLENRSVYFKDMFSERIQNNSNAFNSWKKFDENMNSESKNVFQDPEKINFTNNFSDQDGEPETKLDEVVDTKSTLLVEEVVESKETLAPEISSFESFDENEANVIKMEEESQIAEVRPEFSTSLIANGEHEYLYSEDAIPTQFEFELEIVDSSADTFDVSMADIKEPLESNDAAEFENSGIPDDRNTGRPEETNRVEESADDSDRLPSLHLPDEDSSLMNTGRDSSCDIKDEIPVLNNLLNSTDTAQNFDQLASSSAKFSDSISLVQEVMAAKEMLRKYLPKCGQESISKSRPRTLAEKKQGTGFSLGDYQRSCSKKESSERSSSRNHTRYDKKRSKESSSRSREKHKSRRTSRMEDEPCKYDENTISLRDQKRSSLHSTLQSKESNKIKESSSRSKTESSSKRSGSRSKSRSRKTRESSKDGDRNKIKSYKIPKIPKSRETRGENSTEPKTKEEMPILEPEGGVSLDPSSDRDASLSPPLITNPEDVAVFEQVPKNCDGRISKGEETLPSKMMKAVQMDPGVTLADAVQKWVFHEKVMSILTRCCFNKKRIYLFIGFLIFRRRLNTEGIACCAKGGSRQ